MSRTPLAPPRLAGRLVAALVLLAPAASAQAPTDTTAAGDSVVPNTDPADVRVLRAIYGIDTPLFVVPVRAVNDAAYPVFLAVGPAVAAGALVTGGDLDPALRLAVTGAANFGATTALKDLFKRPRPYAALDGVAARDRGHQGDGVFDPHSFPSGHTSTAFSIATSLSLSYPRWYVVAPSVAWGDDDGAGPGVDRRALPDRRAGGGRHRRGLRRRRPPRAPGPFRGTRARTRPSFRSEW